MAEIAERPDRVADVFEALRDPMRIQILIHLDRGPKRYSDLMRILGLDKDKSSNFAYHIRVLRGLRIIDKKDDGAYQLTELGRFIVAVIKDLHVRVESDILFQQFLLSSKLAPVTFDLYAMISALTRETGIDQKTAQNVCREVLEIIRKVDPEIITTPLIREITCAKLFEHGLESYRHSFTRVGAPMYLVGRKVRRLRDYNALEAALSRRVLTEYTLLEPYSSQAGDRAIGLTRDLSHLYQHGLLDIEPLHKWVVGPAGIVVDLGRVLEETQTVERRGVRIYPPPHEVHRLSDFLGFVAALIDELSAFGIHYVTLEGFDRAAASVPDAEEKADELLPIFIRHLSSKYGKRLTMVLDSIYTPEESPLDRRARAFATKLVATVSELFGSGGLNVPSVTIRVGGEGIQAEISEVVGSFFLPTLLFDPNRKMTVAGRGYLVPVPEESPILWITTFISINMARCGLEPEAGDTIEDAKDYIRDTAIRALDAGLKQKLQVRDKAVKRKVAIRLGMDPEASQTVTPLGMIGLYEILSALLNTTNPVRIIKEAPRAARIFIRSFGRRFLLGVSRSAKAAARMYYSDSKVYGNAAIRRKLGDDVVERGAYTVGSFIPAELSIPLKDRAMCEWSVVRRMPSASFFIVPTLPRDAEACVRMVEKVILNESSPCTPWIAAVAVPISYCKNCSKNFLGRMPQCRICKSETATYERDMYWVVPVNKSPIRKIFKRRIRYPTTK
ncbi:hypothetical protein DRN94_003890 [archaeon]|nr:hypothetical protein [archaeon]